MFKLSELLEYDDIVIQCHNFPDADTIASAYAVHCYLHTNNKKSRIVYSGKAKISKPNLVKMVELLSIPIEYVNEMRGIETLITVDCQYGEGNVAKLKAENVLVIDHHEDSKTGHKGTICSYLGSCSTLVWNLLKAEDFSFEEHSNVATALYYGLYTDTNSFEEIAHPLDRDMRDSLRFNRQIINTLRFNNLTIDELSIAGAALTRYTINERYNCAVFQADACDPNILGFISDLALQVEGADVCIVYNTLPDGYKLSFRSCTKEVMASEFALFFAGGGGHKQKAGGFISKSKIDKAGLSIDDYIKSQMQEYFDSYDVIHAENHDIDVFGMKSYKKLKIPVRYVKTTDVFADGTPILIRTLEGDAEATASKNIYLMIGISGEVYPIKAEKFRLGYTPITATQALESEFTFDYTYSPTAKNKLTGEVVELITHSKSCVSTGDVSILAKPLMRNTKVFTAWNPDGYMYGARGDFLAIKPEDVNDVYIVQKDIFEKTYV